MYGYCVNYGFIFPGGTVHQQLELAAVADANGWDGVFVWEGPYGVDAWSLLAAMATRTTRVRLGTMLTPLPWRRPWKLASQVATLDHLSGGRAILAVGLGAPDVIPRGEVVDRKERAGLMDEGIAILRELWGGGHEYKGSHYDLQLRAPGEPGAFELRPVQPSIPIWVVGAWPDRPKSMRRVLGADGLLPNVFSPEGEHGEATPADIAAMIGWLDANGGRRPGFDVVMEGETGDDHAEATAKVQPWADAGCTWWLESRWTLDGSPAENHAHIKRRLEAGPPSVS